MKVYFIVVGYVSVKWEPSQATQERRNVTPKDSCGMGSVEEGVELNGRGGMVEGFMVVFESRKGRFCDLGPMASNVNVWGEGWWKSCSGRLPLGGWLMGGSWLLRFGPVAIRCDVV